MLFWIKVTIHAWARSHFWLDLTIKKFILINHNVNRSILDQISMSFYLLFLFCHFCCLLIHPTSSLASCKWVVYTLKYIPWMKCRSLWINREHKYVLITGPHRFVAHHCLKPLYVIRNWVNLLLVNLMVICKNTGSTLDRKVFLSDLSTNTL